MSNWILFRPNNNFHEFRRLQRYFIRNGVYSYKRVCVKRQGSSYIIYLLDLMVYPSKSWASSQSSGLSSTYLNRVIVFLSWFVSILIGLFSHRSWTCLALGPWSNPCGNKYIVGVLRKNMFCQTKRKNMWDAN